MNNSYLPRNRNTFLELIVEKHHEQLMLYAIGLCSRFGHKRAIANDVVQDTYLKICVSYETARKGYEKHGLAYLYTCVKHCLIDKGRKYKSFDRVESIFVDEMPKISSIDSLCYDIGHERFYQFLEDVLSENNAEVMKLYIDGYKQKEIAALLDMPQGTVSSNISRSKKLLAPYFDFKSRKKHKDEK